VGAECAGGCQAVATGRDTPIVLVRPPQVFSGVLRRIGGFVGVCRGGGGGSSVGLKVKFRSKRKARRTNQRSVNPRDARA
jgi:hypothetical protein